MFFIEVTEKYADGSGKIAINLAHVESIVPKDEGCLFHLNPNSGTIHVQESYETIRAMMAKIPYRG